MLLRLQRNLWGLLYHEYPMGKIGSKTERCCRIQVSDTFMMSHHNFYWQTCCLCFSSLCIIWQIKKAMWQKWLGISILDYLLHRLLYCICSIYRQETEDVLSTCALFKATNLSKTNHFTSQNTHQGVCLWLWLFNILTHLNGLVDRQLKRTPLSSCPLAGWCCSATRRSVGALQAAAGFSQVPVQLFYFHGIIYLCCKFKYWSMLSQIRNAGINSFDVKYSLVRTLNVHNVYLSCPWCVMVPVFSGPSVHS